VKFDDLLAQYLYENKSLQLQGIGTFALDGAVALPHAQEKEIYYPIEGLTFIYSPKDLTNEDLIAFLVKKLGKIQPLVRSDLESYLSNIKQFINIGKPYTIEGIGTLQKNNQGTYEFTPGTFLPVKEELSPHKDNPEHLHRQQARKSESGRTATIIMIILGVAVVLAGLIWGVMFLMNKNNADTAQEVTGDSTKIQNVAKAPDTLAVNVPDTLTTAMAESDTAVNTYKMIFDVTKSKERIFARSERLKRDGITFKIDTTTINDTLRYRMFIPKRLRATDTLRVKDSLSIFFSRRVIVEKRP
jgi:nucleoid DNA-binding protein